MSAVRRTKRRSENTVLNTQFPAFIDASAPHPIAEYVASGIRLRKGVIVISEAHELNAIKDILKSAFLLEPEACLNNETLIMLNTTQIFKRLKQDSQHGQIFLDSITPILKKMSYRFDEIRIFDRTFGTFWECEDLMNAFLIRHYWRSLSSTFNIECSLPNPLFNEANTRYLLSLSDKSQALQEKEILQQELESEVQKMHCQIRQLQDNLATTKQNKAQFISRISFQIREPLTSILGFAELMAEPNLDEEDLEAYRQKIIEAGKKLTHTANELVGLSAANSLRTINKIQCSMNEIARAIADDLASECGPDNPSLRFFNGEAVTDSILTDPILIRRIVHRVVRFCKSRIESRFVELTITNQTDPLLDQRELTVFIADRGAALTTNEITKLFTPGAGPQSSNDESENNVSYLNLFFARSEARSLGGDLQLICSGAEFGNLFKLSFKNN